MCPSLARLRDGLLDPTRFSDVEREHVSHCPTCDRAVALMGPQLWHPGRLQLWKGSDDRHHRFHLERDRCQRCLTELAFMRRLQELPAKLLGAFAPVRLPLAGVTSYATETPASYRREFELEDGSRACLHEEEQLHPGSAGETVSELHLVLTLSARDPELAERPLRFALCDSRGEQHLRGDLRLEECGEGWYSGTCDLGPTPSGLGDGELWPVFY